jgi:hypothetical protein
MAKTNTEELPFFLDKLQNLIQNRSEIRPLFNFIMNTKSPLCFFLSVFKILKLTLNNREYYLLFLAIP